MATATFYFTEALHVDHATYPSSSSSVKTPSSPTILTNSDILYLKVSSIDGLRKKNITNISFNAYMGYTPAMVGFSGNMTIYLLNVPYDANDIINGKYLSHNINNYINVTFSEGSGVSLRTYNFRQDRLTSDVLKALNNGAALNAGYLYDQYYGYDYISVYPPSSTSYRPYLTITYSDAQLYTSNAVPGSGWINKRVNNVFSWTPKASGNVIDEPLQKSAVFRWRAGSGGTINTINVGTETQITIPANTFPTSEIQWQVNVTSEDNVTATATEWYTVTTVDSKPIATAISPSSSFVDGAAPVTFRWNHSVSTDSPQAAYELQIRSEVLNWTTISSVVTADTFCTIPANTLPSGTIRWRVRTYNSDNLVSEWSNELTAVVVASPIAPSIRVDVVSPRPVISWQSNEQQAYQIQIGEYDNDLVFGVTKTFKSPIYLPDGDTLIRVRVLNEFNLWSPWAEHTITIANTPGGQINLVAAADHDAYLSWNPVENTDSYWIYRDGKLIKRVSATSYTDKLAIGAHSYFVRAALSDNNNYTDSNTVSANLITDSPMISTLDGEWISLRLSPSSTPTTQVSEQGSVSMLQLSGAKYPVPEAAEFKQRSYSIFTAFTDRISCLKFESILGKIVCIKDQYEQIIIGIISSYAKSVTNFFTSYTAVVEEVDGSVYEID